MKFFRWKIFIITSFVCLLPILLGLSLWDKLPETMAIHFNFYGEADGFASKGFVVFGLPIMMVALQFINCLICDINAKKYGDRVKFVTVTKWIIPVLTVLLQIITLGYGLGWDIDIRKAVSFIVGVLFVVLGNYMPKFDQVNGFNVDTEKSRIINRFIGYETVIMGLLFIISIFFPPIFSLICLFLLIPYVIIGIVYAIIVARQK